MFNFKNSQTFKIQQFVKLRNFFTFNIWKINILQYQKLLNILGVQIISKKWRKSSEIKLSNNSSFFILIFAISKFRNTGRSTFRRSKFWPPPDILLLKNEFCLYEKMIDSKPHVFFIKLNHKSKIWKLGSNFFSYVQNYILQNVEHRFGGRLNIPENNKFQNRAIVVNLIYVEMHGKIFLKKIYIGKCAQHESYNWKLTSS